MPRDLWSNAETFIGNPIVALAIGLVLLVIGWRMDSTASSGFLVAAWLLFSLSVFRTLTPQPLVPRVLWSLMCSSILGLLLYHFYTGTTKAPASLSSSKAEAVAVPGDTLSQTTVATLTEVASAEPARGSTGLTGAASSQSVRFYFEAAPAILPTQIARGERLRLFGPQPPASASGTDSLSEYFSDSGALQWPTDFAGRPPAAVRCAITNYGQEPAVNVRIPLTMVYKPLDIPGEGIVAAGRKDISRRWTLVIGKIDPGVESKLVFYSAYLFDDPVSVFITVDDEATFELIGDRARRTTQLSASRNWFVVTRRIKRASSLRTPALSQDP